MGTETLTLFFSLLVLTSSDKQISQKIVNTNDSAELEVLSNAYKMLEELSKSSSFYGGGIHYSVI